MNQTTKPLWALLTWGSMAIPPCGLLLTTVGLIRRADSVPNMTLTSLALAAAIAVAGVLLPLGSAGGRAWIVNRRYAWLLSVAVLFLCATSVDLGLTLTGIVPTLRAERSRSLVYTFDRATGFRLVPQEVTLDDGASLRINSRGFRGDEVESPKPPGRKRVVFLGGSQVFDHRGNDWPRYTGRALRQAGYDLDIVNAGVSGYTSTEAVATLLTDLWVLQPDIVVLCQAWNDVKYFGRLSPNEPYRGLPPDEPRSWFRDWRLYPVGIDRLFTTSAFYRFGRGRIVRLLLTEEGYVTGRSGQTRRPTPALPNEPWGPTQYALNLEALAALTERIGAKLIFCRQAHLSKGVTPNGVDVPGYIERNLGLDVEAATHALDSCLEVIDEIADRRNLPVIDMAASLGNQSRYFYDAVHFNPEGSRMAATLAADAIGALLRDDERLGQNGQLP